MRKAQGSMALLVGRDSEAERVGQAVGRILLCAALLWLLLRWWWLAVRMPVGGGEVPVTVVDVCQETTPAGAAQRLLHVRRQRVLHSLHMHGVHVLKPTHINTHTRTHT